MKSVAIAALAASVVMSAQTFAADTASKFEGFSAEFSTGYQQNKMGGGPIFLTNTGAAAGISVASGDNSKMPAIIGVGYGIKVAPQFVLGFGASYDLTSASIDGVCIGCAPASTLTTKIKNRYNLFIEPGFQVSDVGLAYAKLGYTGVSTSVSASDGSSVVGGPKAQAVSYGLGYKQFFSNNVYGFAEATYASHSDGRVDGTSAPRVFYNTGLKTTNYLIGVGYKF